MKKTAFVLCLAVLMLGAPAVGSAGMPDAVCLNIAESMDEQVQKNALITYPGLFMQYDPCIDEIVTGVVFQLNGWTPTTHKRYVFPSGTITGSMYHGYMGGKVSRYVICADGRAKAGGQSFGYYGDGSIQNICSTL